MLINIYDVCKLKAIQVSHELVPEFKFCIYVGKPYDVVSSWYGCQA